MLLAALWAKGVAKAGPGMFRNVSFHGLPLLLGRANFFTEHADGENALQHPDFPSLTRDAINQDGRPHQNKDANGGVQQAVRHGKGIIPGEAKTKLDQGQDEA